MLQYLIVCPLVFLAGLVDSIAGGGGLIALPAYLIAGVPAHVALGTNKLSSAMGTTVSTARLAKHGFLKGKVLMAVCSSAAALMGSALGRPSGPHGAGIRHQAHDDCGAARCGILRAQEQGYGSQGQDGRYFQK